MTPDILVVFSVLMAAAILFATNLLRSDLVAMLVLLTLLLTDTLTVTEAFAGFSDPTVMIVIAMFIVSEAIVFTGIAASLGNFILRYGGSSELRLMVMIMLVTGVVGAFMSSTATVAIFIPVTLVVAQKANLNHRRLLMPLSIGALVSGMMTLIATTPNLIVNNALDQRGLDGLSFFSFTPFGVAILAAAILFMATIGRSLLSRDRESAPAQKNQTLREMLASYGLVRIHRLQINPGSPLIDRAVARVEVREHYDLQLSAIERRIKGKRVISKATPGTVFEQGDILYFLGKEDNCFAMAKDMNATMATARVSEKKLKLLIQAMGAAEVMLTPESSLIGKNLAKIQFQSRFNGLVIGIRRHGEPITEELAGLPLAFGDVLLISANWPDILKLKEYRDDFLVLTLPEDYRDVIPGRGRVPLVLLILSCMVLAMITGLLPTVTAAVLTATILILTGCLRLERVYQTISWQAIVLIAGILPLATALNKSGAADLLAKIMVINMGDLAPVAMLGFIFILTAAVGLFISNTATAVLIAPIAIDVAIDLGVSPHAFAMTVAIACSAAYATPVSSPVNLLIQEPGRYSFMDFVRVGLPLQLLTLFCTIGVFWVLYAK
ncbi:MAG: SLC13 family permease [Desulforhopalus sp.]|nr:SLC13 family permease [Desulforhopalus sp.]